MSTDLNTLPKDILIMLLKYIEADTINKCSKDLKFLKESIDKLKKRDKRRVQQYIAAGYYMFSHCDCYSDECCSKCDD